MPCEKWMWLETRRADKKVNNANAHGQLDTHTHSRATRIESETDWWWPKPFPPFLPTWLCLAPDIQIRSLSQMHSITIGRNVGTFNKTETGEQNERKQKKKTKRKRRRPKSKCWFGRWWIQTAKVEQKFLRFYLHTTSASANKLSEAEKQERSTTLPDRSFMCS